MDPENRTDREDTPVSRAAFEALQAERDQLLALLRALPDISFVIDTEGRYVRLIGGADEALYANGKGLEGHTLHESLPAGLADQCLSLVRTAVETGTLQKLEYPLQVAEVALLPEAVRNGSPGQTRHWFEGRVLPLPSFDHPRPVALWVAVNITPRKQLEHYWRALAHTDCLTGVATRQRLLERAQREVERAHRHGRPLSLLMMDVDHFKRINDRYGHAAGDSTLRAITRGCNAALRESDCIGRTGGEEFAVLLPETDRDGARQTAERLLATARQVELPDVPAGERLTVSIGGAGLAPGESLDRLMRRRPVAVTAFTPTPPERARPGVRRCPPRG